MSMLKITDISISEICKSAIYFMAGGIEKIVVQFFAYLTGELIEILEEENININHFLPD